jgi:O-antigen ligase
MEVGFRYDSKLNVLLSWLQILLEAGCFSTFGILCWIILCCGRFFYALQMATSILDLQLLDVCNTLCPTHASLSQCLQSLANADGEQKDFE